MLTYVGKYIKPYKVQCVAGPLCKLVEAILELMLPLYMSRIINEGIIPGNKSVVSALGIRMLITIIISLCCAAICQYCASVASQGFGANVRNAMFSHIHRLPFSASERFGADTLVTRITNDTNQLQIAVAMCIRLISRAPFVCIGAIVMAMWMNLSLSAIIWTGVISFSIVLVLIMRAAFPLYGRVQKKLDAIARVLRENLSGIRVIRAFDRTGYERRRFSLSAKEHRDSTVNVIRIASLMTPATSLIMNLLICGTLWFGGVGVNDGEVLIGDVSAYIGYIGLILNSLLVVANLVVIFTKSAASLERINEVLSISPTADSTEPVLDTTEKTCKDLCKAAIESEEILSFSHVNFSYSDASDKNVLSDIHFSINKGETLGIIGGTGSGKSTILYLIMRFYSTQKGEIRMFGVPEEKLDKTIFTQMISCVFQNPRLFSGSLRENLLWGNKDAATGQMHDALEDAQAVEFTSRLPEGLDARVERDGVNFSGGQRQRICVARALVREPRLLLLDDASSALDYATEAELRSCIRRRQKERGMSVVTVSQRIASVRQADRILVLDEGRQVGLGTHEELMASCGLYRAIALAQLPGKV